MQISPHKGFRKYPLPKEDNTQIAQPLGTPPGPQPEETISSRLSLAAAQAQSILQQHLQVSHNCDMSTISPVEQIIHHLAMLIPNIVNLTSETKVSVQKRSKFAHVFLPAIAKTEQLITWYAAGLDNDNDHAYHVQCMRNMLYDVPFLTRFYDTSDMTTLRDLGLSGLPTVLAIMHASNEEFLDTDGNWRGDGEQTIKRENEEQLLEAMGGTRGTFELMHGHGANTYEFKVHQDRRPTVDKVSPSYHSRRHKNVGGWKYKNWQRWVPGLEDFDDGEMVIPPWNDHMAARSEATKTWNSQQRDGRQILTMSSYKTWSELLRSDIFTD